MGYRLNGWAARLLSGLGLVLIFEGAAALAQEERSPRAAAAEPPYNVIFIISDQRNHRLMGGSDYALPAFDAIARHGVSFNNHYIASAMCSPSRAAFLTGQPPQVNHVFDQMEYPYTPTLNPDLPNMGSTLKGLGYKTAYFGKFEMDKAILKAEPTVNYTDAIKSYGFDVFNAAGDIGSSPQSGFDNDPFIAGESVRWLRQNAEDKRRGGKPFFMVASFVNPHDIMYGDANVPGQPPIEKAVSPKALPPLPANSIYQKKWPTTPATSLHESLNAPGMPGALLEYKTGWDGWSGTIPTDRADMWDIFYNYYLNAIRDEDRALQQIIDVLNEMDLWRDTVVIFTADHGEMAGSHGGLKGKGPFSYENNAHVPLIVAHPVGKTGASTLALTSHLDLLPTLVGLTGVPESSRPAAVKALPGHDFSALLADPEKAAVQAVRPGVLFNYMGVSTVDANYLREALAAPYVGRSRPPLSDAKLDKRGLLSFVFDGRYKFARYYAPTAFNTPQTIDELFKSNDVQLFDLTNDPEEVHNLAAEPDRNRETLLRMNSLLNELITKEVGVNDGRFLAPYISAK
jgi:arylsulfatase A-like enzyme